MSLSFLPLSLVSLFCPIVGCSCNFSKQKDATHCIAAHTRLLAWLLATVGVPNPPTETFLSFLMSNRHHAEYAEFAAQGGGREEVLQTVLESYGALAQGQGNWVCNLANAASLLWYAYHSLGVRVNWAGFYTAAAGDDSLLVLGPFQGKVACQTIEVGRGVCGTAAASRSTQLVPNVDEYPSHIACDGQTRSEIVVPVVCPATNRVLAVIDLDCLDLAGFSDVDQVYLEKLAVLIAETCVF